MTVRAMPAVGLKARLLNRATVNGTYLPAKRFYNIVPTMNVIQSTIYRTNVILNYDYASKKGFVTKRSPQEARECLKRLKKLYELIDKKYDEAAEDYHENFRRLTSLSFWNNYLKIRQGVM